MLCAFGSDGGVLCGDVNPSVRNGFSRASKTTGIAAETFSQRSLSLWHAKDEALQSLKAVKKLDVEVSHVTLPRQPSILWRSRSSPSSASFC